MSNSRAKAKATASTVGNACVVIETTSAKHPTLSATETINVAGGRATAHIKSTSPVRG